LYSRDNQSLPSTIFNQAHNRKLNFEQTARYPTS
jgi:hypothetical protein